MSKNVNIMRDVRLPRWCI